MRKCSVGNLKYKKFNAILVKLILLKKMHYCYMYVNKFSNVI